MFYVYCSRRLASAEHCGEQAIKYLLERRRRQSCESGIDVDLA